MSRRRSRRTRQPEPQLAAPEDIEAAHVAVRCYPAPDGRVLRSRHLSDCDGSCRGCTARGHRSDCDDTCRGCQPCTRPHCTLCTRDHADDVCPRCLAGIRGDLTDLAAAWRLLDSQALHGAHRGHLSADSAIPGGMALVLLGPVSAGLDSGEDRAPDEITAARYRDEWVATMAESDWEHPALMLRSWVVAWAEWLGIDEPGAHDALTDVGWLLDHLADMTDVEDAAWRPDLADMRAELTTARTQVENVAHAGQRPDRGRVPCLTCGARLERLYDGPTADQDRWSCPRCHRLYSHGEHLRAQADEMAGADAWVPVKTAADLLERSTATLRAWIGDLRLSARCSLASRVVEVWWPDARSCDAASLRRTRQGG